MSNDASYLWIKTRDGSPTIWSNELSEPFRSTKGAFSESWEAFVCPALGAAKGFTEAGEPIVVGEFGLGPGTNWVLWTVAANLLGYSFDYFVIERDRRFFEDGLLRWSAIADEIMDFVFHKFRDSSVPFDEKNLEATKKAIHQMTLPMPRIYENMEAALNESKNIANIWFHDPFGCAVNPEGYSHDTIKLICRLWSPFVCGYSYACNRAYKEALNENGFRFFAVDTCDPHLKRQRSEFYGPLTPPRTELK